MFSVNNLFSILYDLKQSQVKSGLINLELLLPYIKIVFRMFITKGFDY